MHKNFNDMVIEGSGGGGKGGSSGSGATEAPNTLRSKSKARFVELLAEGEIFGLIDGAKSIILNKIAVENPDGSRNWEGFGYDQRTGTSDQSPLPGITNIASEQQVNLRVKNSKPVIYRTQGAQLDAVRVTLQLPALTKLDKKTGGMNGYNVNIAIDVKSLSNPNNAWVTRVAQDYISGKCTAPYERSYRLGLDGNGPWQIRMRRLSVDDDNDSSISSQTIFSHITEIIDQKVAYADSAVVGIEIDTEQFGQGVADREYDIKGLLMEYPSNYNPETRTYTGFWDGTWAYGYCNNPAWFFRWLAINPRFGIGLPEKLIDKWGLFELSKYCDFMVSDGVGGMEPRFVFNGEIADQDEAFKVLQMLASSMRAIVFYSSGAVIVRQDAPMAPEQRIYTPANVIGKFTYASSALSVRHNACIVSWVNPDLGWETDYEVYEDREAINKFGYNQLEIKAIGTTSRGQAYRQAKWAILTEQLQKDTITFDAGFDSSSVLPGDIIEVADPHKATADFGGRLYQPQGANLLSLNNCKVSGWAASGVTTPAEYVPGPWGARNLRKVQAVANSSNYATTLITNAFAPATTGDYTFSFFVKYGNVQYIRVHMAGASFSFDIVNKEVRFTTETKARTNIVDVGDGLVRVSVTRTLTANQSVELDVGFDTRNNSLTAGGLFNPISTSGQEIMYLGCMQVDAGQTATYPTPARPNGTTQVMLDRDIEYTGALSPQLHITLVDGAFDDKVGLDNTDRLVKRKVRYFSAAATAYDPETQIITLGTAIPTGTNDGQTPLVWIFSKTQVTPKPYKVVSNKENEDKSYTITAIEYVVDKYRRLDEGFTITYDMGNNFSNLPQTSFCAPPVGPLKIDAPTILSNANMQQSLVLGWGASPDMFLRGYVISYKRGDENWITLPICYDNFYELQNAINGAYIFKVRAVSRLGTTSSEISGGIDLSENSFLGRGSINSIYTDTGGTAFNDRDIRLFWSSTALSASPDVSSITATVNKGAGAGTSDSADGYLVTGGSQTVSSGTATVDITDAAAPKVTLGGTFAFGDQVVVGVGLSTFTVEFGASDTLASFAKAIADKIDLDPRYLASRASGVITITFADGATNASTMEAANDPLFRRYVINVYDSVTNALKRVDYSRTSDYVYSYATNTTDFITPSRNVKFAIGVEDVFANVSAMRSVVVSNAPPIAPVVTIDLTPYSITLNFVPPTDPDYAGILVHLSTTPNFTPSAATLVYQDRGNPSIPVSGNTTYYLRYAFYDAFGMTGIALSAEQQVNVPGVSFSDVDTTPPSNVTLPANPLTLALITDPATKLPSVEMTFNWNAVSDADVVGYDIQYREGSGPWIGGYSVKKDYTTHKLPAKTGTAYSAQVRAVDKMNNVSLGWSPVASAAALKDNTIPAVPTWVSTEAAFESAFLRWTNAADADVAFVEIWENSTNSSASATKIATVGATAGAPGTYVRINLQAGSIRYYWLKSIDTSGNVSGFGAVSTATTAGYINLADFTPGLQPISTVATLPSATGYTGPTLVFNQADGKLYRYVSGAWVKAVDGADIAPSSVTTQALVDASITAAKIADAQLTAAKFTSTVRPIETFSTNPTSGNFEGRQVYNSTDKKLYRYDATAGVYTTSVATTDLTGTISGAQIAAAALDVTKFTSSVRPVEVLGALPTTGNFAGRTVLLTTDGKLYRYFGSAYTAAVPTTDLSGTVASTQIADAAITANKIADAVITATKFTSTIKPIEIVASLPTTGNVQGRTVFLTTDNKLYRYSTATGSYTAAVATVDLTGTISGAQIADAAVSSAKLVDASVVTAKLADAAISVAKIQDNAVTASKILDTSITLSKFATNLAPVENVSALPSSGNFQGRVVLLTTDGKIYRYNSGAWTKAVDGADLVANSVTANSIAAATITANQIAAGTITGTQIAANSISTNRLLVSDLTNNAENPNFQQGNVGWGGANIVSDSTNAYNGGTWVGRIETSSVSVLRNNMFMAVTPGDELYGYANVKTNGAVTSVWARITFVNSANAEIANPTSATFTNLAAYTVLPVIATVPANAVGARIEIVGACGSTAGRYIYVGAAGLLRRAGGNLIVDGAVTALKIAANTITAGQIAAGTISATEIASGAITADKIATNAVTTDKLLANSITAGKLVVGTRPISTVGINLRIVANRITWDSGAVITASDTGLLTATAISAGSVPYPGSSLYLVWNAANKSGSFDYGTDINITVNPNYSHIATWESGTQLTVVAGVGTIITGDRIVTGSVTAAQIAASTITAGNIAAGTITATQIASGTITTNEIAAGTISAANIAAGAITASKLLIADLTQLIIDPGFRDTGYWSNVGVFNGPLGTSAGSVPGWYNSHGTDVAGTMGSTQYAMLWDGYFTGTGRQHLYSPMNKNIKGGTTYQFTVTCNNASNQMFTVIVRTYDNLGNLIGDAGSLSWNAGQAKIKKTVQMTTAANISAYQIIMYNASGVAFSGNFQAMDLQITEVIGGTLIQNGAITTTQIAANTITAGNIVAGTITSAEIATRTIVALDIATGTLTSTEIAANTITAGNIAANTITAGQIAAGTITATQIAASSITTNRLLVSDLTNNAENPNFQQGNVGWGGANIVSDSANAYNGGTWVGRIETSAVSVLRNNMFMAVTPGDELYGFAWVKTNGAVTSVWARVTFVNAANAEISNPTSPTYTNLASYTSLPINATAPAGAVGARIEIVGACGSTAGRYIYIGAAGLLRRANSNLIVDGSISALKIATNSITALQIATDTITANQIAAGAIGASEIAANAVTAAKIAAGTITANEIASGTITAGLLAANSVTADKILANSVGANKLIAGSRPLSTVGLNMRTVNGSLIWDAGAVISTSNTGTLDTTSITANTIAPQAGSLYIVWNAVDKPTYFDLSSDINITVHPSFKHIATWQGGNVLTIVSGVGTIINGDRIVTGSISADKIIANTITSAQIAAGTITANNIATGTITAAQIATGAITANKILITSMTDLIADPGFRDTSFWNNVGTYNGPLGTTAGSAGPGWYNSHGNDINNIMGTTMYCMLWEAYKTDSGRQHLYSARQYNIKGGTSYQFSAACRNGSNQRIYAYVRCYDVNNGNLPDVAISWPTTDTGKTPRSTTFVAPANAVSYEIIIFNEAGSTWSGNCQVTDLQVIEQAGATAIRDGAITTDKITVGSLNGDRITAGTVNAAAITAGTVMSNLVQIANTGFGAGFDLGAVAVAANNPAARINAGTTTIGPGFVTISGSTTLANWRNGSDSTKIEGGSIAANTIAANKLTIGNRGISVSGLDFSYNRQDGNLYWSSGYIYWTDDNNVAQATFIAASGLVWQGGTNNYLYWNKGAGSLSAGVDNYGTIAAGGGANSVLICAWNNGNMFNVNYGMTTVDGDRITTGSINANKIVSASITATQIATNTITAQQIATGTITATQIAVGTITANRLSVTQLSAIATNIGTVTAGVVKSADNSAVLDLDNKRLVFVSGGYRTVQGAALGPNSNMILWMGPNSITLGSETIANSRFAWGTDGKVYYGAAEIGGAGVATLNGTYNSAVTKILAPGQSVSLDANVYAEAGGNNGTITCVVYGQPTGTANAVAVQGPGGYIGSSEPGGDAITGSYTNNTGVKQSFTFIVTATRSPASAGGSIRQSQSYLNVT